MPDQNWQFELEEYIRQGEPDRAEKSEAWQTAIGLQAVDGLNTSAYLLNTAKDHIEGKITIDEVQRRIHSLSLEKLPPQHKFLLSFPFFFILYLFVHRCITVMPGLRNFSLLNCT